MTENNTLNSMSIKDILSILPHRYPFILLDSIYDYCIDDTNGKVPYLIGQKNVTINEHFFVGHFPQEPVMPGVLILESMAQACCILSHNIMLARIVDSIKAGNKDSDSSISYLVGIDNAKFIRKVTPGNNLFLNVFLVSVRRGIAVFDCNAEIIEEGVVESDDIKHNKNKRVVVAKAQIKAYNASLANGYSYKKSI